MYRAVSQGIASTMDTRPVLPRQLTVAPRSLRSLPNMPTAAHTSRVPVEYSPESPDIIVLLKWTWIRVGCGVGDRRWGDTRMRMRTASRGVGDGVDKDPNA
ncbi:hypothetical protein B0H13DRAFT_2268494 [Mycena leptocephala]|nr:hypothetical protein B0H13DRAFT_2268494 [Mycena leptocephala]